MKGRKKEGTQWMQDALLIVLITLALMAFGAMINMR